ncbi:MAG TPA: CHAT domain-containing protein, partial [Acidimicrobiales bacterium]|nr:CHAT domain-containing protein [Acidimicrobiales bacterium]
LVEGAVRDARPDRQVGNTLYELLLPNDLKGDLARSDNLQLVVDENTADLPWEALTARFGGSRARQLALRGGLLRQFRETEAARAPARGPVGQRALVIGNPPPPPGLRSLPGASREAAAVAEALRSRFDVSALVWGPGGEPLMDDFPDISGSTGSRILDALFSQDWRIVHIAAHGRFEPSDPSASGVVLDDGIHLTANVVRQLAAVPELVFLNCCHLGRVAGDGGPEPVAADRHRLAAGVSRQLMGIGVHAVVAAGWAVEDDAAVVFAEAVYERLLAGAFFGAAVQAARTTVHRRFEASSTWAAFQCYGDPGFRLFGAEPPEPAVPVVVSAGELVRRVRSIGVLAGKIGLPDFEELSARGRRLVAELDAHRRAAGDRGWATPAVLYRLGEAYGELGAYEQAVACYRQAWDHPDAASAPVRLLEQLGNFEVRLAQERRRAGGRPPGDGVAGLVEAAEGHLLLAHGLGATPERAALLASFHKKAGTLAAGEERRRHTAAAARRYREAVDLGAGRGAPAAYHVLNWLQLAALAVAPVAPREAAAALDGVAAGQGAEAGPEDFWSRVGRADAALTRYVLGLVTGPGELEAGYRSAFATRSSRRDRDSVVDHLLDVAELGGDAALAALARALDPPP